MTWLKGQQTGATRCVNKGRPVHIPVLRMFMSMCLGVSPSSNGIEAGAGVLVFLNTAEAVLFLVAGRDFLVILWKEDRLVNFRLNNILIIHCYHHHYSALLHLTHFKTKAAPQDVLWSLGTSIFASQSTAAPDRTGTLCFGVTKDKTAQN